MPRKVRQIRRKGKDVGMMPLVAVGVYSVLAYRSRPKRARTRDLTQRLRPGEPG